MRNLIADVDFDCVYAALRAVPDDVSLNVRLGIAVPLQRERGGLRRPAQEEGTAQRQPNPYSLSCTHVSVAPGSARRARLMPYRGSRNLGLKPVFLRGCST